MAASQKKGAQPRPDKAGKTQKQKQPKASRRWPFLLLAALPLAPAALWWRSQPPPPTPFKPQWTTALNRTAPLPTLARVGGVVVDGLASPETVAALRAELERAVADECAAPGPVCFDPARVDIDPATGARHARSPLPAWVLKASRDPRTGVRRLGADHCVRSDMPEAQTLREKASVSYVVSRDELPAARAAEAAVEAATGLRGSAGLFLQFLYYPSGAGGYEPHTDCRFDEAGAALGQQQGAVHRRPFTTLLYLNDVDGGGETVFPKLDDAKITPKAGRLAAWRNVDAATESYCDDYSTHAAAAVPRDSPPKMVIQRWYEAEPLLPPPNAHDEAWTRCGLDNDGVVESCRTYCASAAAGKASAALTYGLEAFGAFKAGDAARAADAREALEAALSWQPGLATALIVLAHVRIETGDLDDAAEVRDICSLLVPFLAQYPDVAGVSDEALLLATELDCYNAT